MLLWLASAAWAHEQKPFIKLSNVHWYTVLDLEQKDSQICVIWCRLQVLQKGSKVILEQSNFAPLE